MDNLLDGMIYVEARSRTLEREELNGGPDPIKSRARAIEDEQERIGQALIALVCPPIHGKDVTDGEEKGEEEGEAGAGHDEHDD